MIDRRQVRALGRQQVKRHYILLAMLCIVTIFLGTNYTELLSNAQTWYDVLAGQVTRVDTDGLVDRKTGRDAVMDDLIQDNIEAGKQDAAERLRELREASDPNSVLGRRRGALAAIVNTLSSGKMLAMVGTALRSIFRSGRVVVTLIVIASVIVYGLVWVFFRNMYSAVMRRAFLETRTYRAFPLGHLLYFVQVRRWVRASMTLLLESVLGTLWALTIVGGVIKRYSYFLVPYIVAENPDIRPREAITLSRRMMNGHKWECFLLEASYFPWMVLGFFTFGISEALWSLPCRLGAFAEVYARLREAAKASGIPGAEKLNDDCLFRPADADTLNEVYGDIVRREGLIDEDIVQLSPRQRFFARNFGIWTGSLAEKKVFSRQEGLRHQMRVGMQEKNGEAYPQRMSPLWNRKGADITGRVNYLAPCTVWTLVTVFFAFCLVGWVWEVALFIIKYGTFANRGALHGPWLPIYGSGVVMIAVLLYRLRGKPLLEALSIVVLCGLVEYMTSYVMEMTRGMRWWDYTGYFLNLNGRICGEGLAVFAIGGMVAVYLLVPIIDSATARVKPRVLVSVCVILLVIFIGDLVYSHFVPNVGRGITDEADEAALLPGAPETTEAPPVSATEIPSPEA